MARRLALPWRGYEAADLEGVPFGEVEAAVRQIARRTEAGRALRSDASPVVLYCRRVTAVP